MSTICLNMIVKNESHIILETLENLCEKIHFDHWVIADTGSTDNTPELITDFFKQKKIKGEIVHHQWKNFSHNRTLALEACTGKTDYILFFDADDLIEGSPNIPKKLMHDAYFFTFTSENKSTKYLRKLLVRNNGNFYWRGVVHEFIDQRKDITTGYIDGDYAVISRRLGARNQINFKQKYLRDAELLTQAFNDKEDPELLPRYAFYAAQSYNDAEEPELAEKWYLKRVELEGWYDERYMAYLRLGFIAENRQDFDKAIEYWTSAIKITADRAEAWYHIARRYNWNKQFALAYAFATQGETKSLPSGNRLFLHNDIYRYWIKYETCINAYQCGNFQHSYESFKGFIKDAPQHLIQRMSWQIEKYEEFIHKDTFDEIKSIRSILLDKGLNEIVDKYFSF